MAITGSKFDELLALLHDTASAKELTEAQRTEIYEHRDRLTEFLQQRFTVLLDVELLMEKKEPFRFRNLDFMRQAPDPSVLASVSETCRAERHLALVVSRAD